MYPCYRPNFSSPGKQNSPCIPLKPWGSLICHCISGLLYPAYIVMLFLSYGCSGANHLLSCIHTQKTLHSSTEGAPCYVGETWVLYILHKCCPSHAWCSLHIQRVQGRTPHWVQEETQVATWQNFPSAGASTACLNIMEGAMLAGRTQGSCTGGFWSTVGTPPTRSRAAAWQHPSSTGLNKRNCLVETLG